MIGEKFGRLLVVGESLPVEVGRKQVIKREAFMCLCDCGASVVVTKLNLKSGNSKSCGCFKRDAIKAANYEHGRNSKDKTYQTWAAMRARCRNEGNEKYKNYGARGIKVCARWDDFQLFLEDMGERPSGKTIDRIDVNGGYEPSNCRWATPQEQARNRTDNRILTIDGVRITLTDCAAKFGMYASTLHKRLARGLTAKQATANFKEEV